MNDHWTVYIIQAKSKKLYTGITKDLARRITEHKEKVSGARFFRFSSPEDILYQEYYPNRSEATKQEIKIKKMSRKEKLALIKDSKKKDV